MIFTITSSRTTISLFATILLSVFIAACSDNTSSNGATESKVIGNESGGSTVTTVDGAVIEVAPDGTPNIIEDPNDNANVTENSDGGFIVTTDGATVTTSPDGNVINQAN